MNLHSSSLQSKNLFLENEQIKLRAVEPYDLEKLYLWENNTALWIVGNTRQPLSKYAIKQYIVDAEKDIFESRQLRLMITDKSSNETVGTVDLFDYEIYHNRLALGLYIDAQFQGKGLATQALHLVENYVFDFLHIHQLYCHISELNTASRTMFEKEGYESNGILKNWVKTPEGYENIIVFQRFADKK